MVGEGVLFECLQKIKVNEVLMVNGNITSVSIQKRKN